MCKRRRRNACGAVVAAVLTRSCYPTYGCYSSGRAGPHPDPPCTPRASAPRASGSAADSSSWFVFRHQTEQQSSNMQHAPCQATVQTGRPGVLTCMHDTPAPRPSLDFGSRAGRHARTRPGNARTGPAQPRDRRDACSCAGQPIGADGSCHPSVCSTYRRRGSIRLRSHERATLLGGTDERDGDGCALRSPPLN